METAMRIVVMVVVSMVLLFSRDAWPGVEPRIEVDHPVMQVGQAGEVQVRVLFDVPADVRAGTERPPLNLALVMDRSGSMADRGKLEYARQAALVLVSALKPEDRLTLVQYDNTVQTLWSGAPIGDGTKLRRLIRGMRPGGSTNLYGGLRQGIDGCLEGADRERVSRVFLLSDGLANVGLTDPGDIAAMAAGGRGRGVRVSAMGLGAEYDEDLMQAVAESGGGSYHFIEHPSQTMAIYERELQVLSAMITRELRFRFVPTKRVRDVTVYGYLQEKEQEGTAVTMDELYAGEKRSMIVRLQVAGITDNENELGRFEWSYIDTQTGGTVTGSAPVRVTGSRDKDEISSRTNTDVVAEGALARAEQEHREAVVLFENGQVEEAQARLGALKFSLAAQEAAAPSVALRKKMDALDVEAEMQRQSAGNASMRSRYIKKSKANIYHSAKGKREGVMLEPGDRGDEVRSLQEALRDQGCYGGPVDGEYSAGLERAVRDYQKANGLVEDGVAGPKVLNSLGLY